MSPNSMSFVGLLTLQTLESYYVDKMFFSCKGLHEDWGISDSNELQALVKEKEIQMANKKYLLLDHTKLGNRAFSHIGKTNEIDVLIIDSNAVDESVALFKKHDVQILKVE